MYKPLLFLASFFIAFAMYADPGDTLVVQTYTFEEQNNPETAYDNPGRRWFSFPDDDTQYQKILMYHTLKCFEDGTAGNLGFPCGEWDYLSYNYLFDHTGVLDSTLLDHPKYLLSNQDFDAVELYTEPQYQTVLYAYEAGDSMGLDELASWEVGLNDLTDDRPLEFTKGRGRAQFIYSADELTSAGFAAGELDRIALQFSEVNGSADVLYLRVKWTDETEVGNSFDNEDLVQVYAMNTNAADLGWRNLDFTAPQSWDGTSNLLIDLAYLSENAVGNVSVDGNEGSTLVSAEKESFLRMDWYDEVKVPSATFDEVEDQITIEFWIRGDEDIQPQSSTIFEGVDADNQRQLNSHLPWDNGRVYWDAGNDGGYDRIDKAANSASYEGVWNHWAFTKNVSEETMKIYLNGELWHEGTDKDNPIGDIEKFSISAAVGWSNYYTGDVDEFRIWSTELDGQTIADWMLKSPSQDHPNADALQLRYDFNQDQYTTVVEDKSGNERHGELHGSPMRMAYHPKDIFFNAEAINFRPYIKLADTNNEGTLIQGTWQQQELTEAQVLAEWEVQGYDVGVVSNDFVWTSTYTYTYDEFGALVDSMAIGVPPNEVLNDELSYYGAPFEVVDRYELGRYITPYGINLDLEDGWTWVFDVTDYAPLLTGEVELECGNWQELLDLKFLFIEGTPPREVKRVEAFWKGQHQLNTWDESVLPYAFAMEDGEEMVRLKTRTSGHFFGQGNNCAEFCNNTHSVLVNGQEQWSWEIMQECADNPLYPQGGTWVYDRAGWCPGAPTTTRNFELTPLIQGDEEFTVEYDIDYDPYGNYRFEGQIITYGAANFQNDVEVSDILAPSNMKVKSRMNPICSKPMIRIRNNGVQPLTSCTITYGVNGQLESYEWTGNLGFLETEDVELNYLNPSLWDGEVEDEVLTFQVSVDLPNGVQDENTANNLGTSRFVRPPVYDYGSGEDDNNELIIWTRTNTAPWETEIRIEDMDGNLAWLKTYSEANTIHRDTIQLNGGCYKFHLKDSDDDGLSFFANNDGSGYVRLKKVAGGNFHIFEDDFGKEIVHYFNWRTDLVNIEEQEIDPVSLSIFPNPTNGRAFIKLSDYSGVYDLHIYNVEGREVYTESSTLRDGDLIGLDVFRWTPGMYAARVILEGREKTVRFLVE